MTKIVFIHSGGPQDNMQGSTPLLAILEKELMDYNIIAPIMPSPEDPSYYPWAMKLEAILSDITEDVILIGHSLGGSVIMKYLTENETQQRIIGIYLIAAPFWGKEGWEFSEFYIDSNLVRNLPYNGTIYAFYSETDDTVPIVHAEEYARIFSHVRIERIKQGPHSFEQGVPEMVIQIKKQAQ